MSLSIRTRPALMNDLPALVALEEQSFTEDRISRRQFRWMLRRGHCALIMGETDSQSPAGYILVLFHRGTSLGRIYSLVVENRLRG